MNSLKLIAEANLHSHIQQNSYPGRGFDVGLSEDGKNLVMVFWTMGRSEDSRNRIFVLDGTTIRTEAIDPTKVLHPELTLYPAMMEADDYFVVTNGRQTDTVLDALHTNHFPVVTAFTNGLADWSYESDLNHTSRISAVCCRTNSPTIVMSVIKKSPFSDSPDRLTYAYESVAPGFGYCLTTYEKDGKPLIPPFSGEPLIMPLSGDIDAVLGTYWGALDEANRVSLAVKFAPLSGGLSTVKFVNKYSKP